MLLLMITIPTDLKTHKSNNRLRKCDQLNGSCGSGPVPAGNESVRLTWVSGEPSSFFTGVCLFGSDTLDRSSTYLL